MILLPLLLLNVLVSSAYADNWAVLVAGSNNYYNYRHQADICHAYQILSKHGIPDDRIIVFMYDDIAYNSENPFQGNLINKPNGPNVYPKVPKNYVKDTVTPQNFINCLLGKSTVGKNLQSTSKDNVFIYLADHGAPGLFAFPNDVLYVEDLQRTLELMWKEKKYNKMIIYMESCESGSMFSPWLENNIEIYATTASTPAQPSYACYYDPDRKTYLGDVYSVNWLENSDSADFSLETIFQQFAIDRNKTKTSTVCEYGNITIAETSPLSDFMGNKEIEICNIEEKVSTDAVLSRRAGLISSYKNLEKWFSLPYSKIQKDMLRKDLDQLNNHVKQFIEASHLYKTFYKSKADEYSSDPCETNKSPSKECLQKIVQKYFNGFPNEYQLDLLAETNPCS